MEAVLARAIRCSMEAEWREPSGESMEAEWREPSGARWKRNGASHPVFALTA
jgi:hypothetical protein